MIERQVLKDVAFVNGTLSARHVYDKNDCAVFEYDPKDWQLDVTLTRKFTPGFYQQYKRGEDLKYTFILYIEDSGGLRPLAEGWEWRRVYVSTEDV